MHHQTQNSSRNNNSDIWKEDTWKGEIDTLTEINGTNGFKLLGENSGDYSGYSVSFAGDVNSDGIQDFIIGARYWNKSNTMTHVGRSYVVFGKEGGGWPAMMNLSTIDGKNGFTLDGSVSGEWSGWSVSNAGDVNNDGKDDLIIGAPYWNSKTGRAFVVYGQSPCPMKMYLSGNGTCKNCTLGNGCLTCSGINGTCTSCPNKMSINGTGCQNCTLGNGCLNCSGKTGECTSCPNRKVVSGTGCVDGTVVVIEVNNNTTITEEDIANEIKKIMGVDVTVIEVNKGTFEVTLTDITKANQLISTIDICRKTP